MSAGTGHDPVVALHREFLAVQMRVNELNLESQRLGDGPRSAASDAVEKALDVAVSERTRLSERIAETPALSAAGVFAKVSVIATYFNEENPNQLDIEGAVALSAGADVDRLMVMEQPKPRSITDLFADIQAIRNGHIEDDVVGKAVDNLLSDATAQLLRTPASSCSELLLKAKLVAQEDEDGPLMTIQPRKCIDFLVADLERMAALAK